MCTFVYVRFVIGFFSFFAPWEPLGSVTIVQHFPDKGDSAAILPQFGENTVKFSRNWWRDTPGGGGGEYFL